ncbi:MAG TPA: ketoacyl-ACP synthase III [Candidatus Krumholzibacteria bacterium]|nr:ketoacyl-ACP synthase III [Candidatus Krumholzibacteria bacterium]
MSPKPVRTTIVSTGSFLPGRIVPNAEFLDHEFHHPDGRSLDYGNAEIIEKFQAITGINARQYVTDDQCASDIACIAAEEALSGTQFDRETLDYIIVAHNFGDVPVDNRRSDLVPTLAARVKHRLGIQNPKTIAYDLPFGCAGWLQAVIQADYFIKSGDAKRALVIGAETLSRVIDPHDRDSMIYADGAGACVLEGIETDAPVGVLAHTARSDTAAHADLIRLGRSSNPRFPGSDLFLKMDGHKVYEYALRAVPRVVKECVVKAGLDLRDISKILIHQANAKMDEAILERIYRLFGTDPAPDRVMPMTISWLGNSSVATIPTLLDLILKGRLEHQRLNSGERIVLAAVGAGMNINALVYGMV